MKNNETLAQFLLERREKLGYTKEGLATRANIDPYTIDDLESGRELFLPASIRQKLANALKINAIKIKSLEKEVKTSEEDFELADKIDTIKFDILNKSLKGHKCPACGSELICRVAIMYDLEDNMVRHPKARCSKCPLQIK